MSNSINLLSPSFRDYLLLKNLVTDTVVDNGLQSLLTGVGKQTEIETQPNAVQPSNSINNTGPVYQELNTILNQYQGGQNDYTQVDIVLNNSINSTITQSGPYTSNNELLNGSFYYNGNLVTSESIRQDLTTKNVYVDTPKQTVINLNTQPVTAYQNLTSYIDENNNLNVGGPSTKAADILAGIATGQGVGFSAGGGLVANEDIRSTLLGRVLGATGVINDTPLGNIGGQQLSAHIGYNAAFGLQQETLGSLNLNPLSLLQGKPPVNLNYSVTVPSGTLGKVLNFAANVLGAQSPVSLLKQSIYTFDDKGIFISVGNIERGNNIIKNTGKGQVNSLFLHLQNNVRINKEDKTLRQGYAPKYEDDRIAKGENTFDSTNYNLYARDNGQGEIQDFLNGEQNSPITSGNYDRSAQIVADGWDKDYFEKNDYNSQKLGEAFIYKDSWGWGDIVNNKDSNVALNDNSKTLFDGTEKNKKSILYKTQQLFNSNNMLTLVTGHGIKEKDKPKSQINSNISSVGSYTSKGSGVMSFNAVTKRVDDGPENVFCRTWTTYDRYAQVLDLQKHRGLYGGGNNSLIFRKNVEFSVLDDNGFAKVAPLKRKDNKIDNTKYMFSIENLAWNDNLTNLLPCEIGPGDPLSNHKGRIMWFPPYDINFSESTSANWDKHNFIGRGEPIYTYNNTERSGNLSWKIIIDHPNYLNFIGKATGITPENYDEYLASYFAGCIPQEDLKSILTTEEITKTEIVNVEKKPEIKIEKDIPPPSFDVYFPNDVYDIDKYPDYENGECDNNLLLFTLNPNSKLNSGKFSPDGTKVVTAAYNGNAKIWDVSNGNSLFNLVGHTNIIEYAEFSPDGTKVVTASRDNKAKIWDVSNGTLLFTLAGHTSTIKMSRFSPDNTKVVTSSLDNVHPVKIWDVSNGYLLFTLVGHLESVDYAEFSPDNSKVVTASDDNTAKIWDVSNGTLLFTLAGHTSNVNISKFSPDGTKVITASNDNTAKIWDVSNGTLLFTLAGHTNAITYAEFSPDNSKVVTASDDNTAKIWDVSNGTLLFTLKVNDGSSVLLSSSKFSPDGTKVVTASLDNTAKIWDVSNGTLLFTLAGHSDGVKYAEFSPDGTKIVTASLDKTAKIWNTNKTDCIIDYAIYPNGENYGLVKYSEMCYKYTNAEGKEVWSSTASDPNCQSTDGKLGRTEPDRTNFGLNASGGSSNIKNFFKPVEIDGKKYKSWRDPQYHKDLQEYLLTKCKSCKVEVLGYASEVGTDAKGRNARLSTLRAENIVSWLQKNILTEPPFKDRVKINSGGQGISSRTSTSCPKAGKARTNNYNLSENDIVHCKANRYVTVRFIADESIIPKEEPKKEPEKIPEPPKVPSIPTSRFYSECDYFEKLALTDATVYDTIRQKIKYFQPAFHSTTPEGFNSRLTFLQQCMRQGPTLGAGKTNNPNNLAFGRPPVCILRIGDFYHTKIVIENLNFTFEPLVWDLNPEGVGVQPMICNVDMSFSFIGGSSLRGPINKLQNAVSFNYFANSEIYDPRADTIKITEGSSTGVILDGLKSIAADYNLSPEAQQIAGLTSQIEPNINQVNQNNNINSDDNSQPLNKDGENVNEFAPKLIDFKSISVTKTEFSLDTTGKQYDITILMNNKNIMNDDYIFPATEKYVNDGIVISVTSIPMPDIINNSIIDNGFSYQETVKFMEDGLKGIEGLVKKGYKLGTNSGINIPKGYYKLSVKHASEVICNATITVDEKGYFYPEGPALNNNNNNNTSGGGNTNSSVKEISNIQVNPWYGTNNKYSIIVNLLFNNLKNGDDDNKLNNFLNKGLKIRIEDTIGNLIIEESVVLETPNHKSIKWLLLGEEQSLFGFYVGNIIEPDSTTSKIIIEKGTYILKVIYDGSPISKTFTV